MTSHICPERTTSLFHDITHSKWKSTRMTKRRTRGLTILRRVTRRKRRKRRRRRRRRRRRGVAVNRHEVICTRLLLGGSRVPGLRMQTASLHRELPSSLRALAIYAKIGAFRIIGGLAWRARRGPMPGGPASSVPRPRLKPPSTSSLRGMCVRRVIYTTPRNPPASISAPPSHSHSPLRSVLRRRRRPSRATASESKRRRRAGGAPCSCLQCRTHA